MPYERSKKIEDRFEKAVSLIRDKRLNASQLAEALNVSRPTVQRIVTELKRRGYPIRSVHEEYGWRYEMVRKRRTLKKTDKEKNRE